MFSDHTTLTEFLIEERRRHPLATGELNALVLEVAVASKAIAARAAYGALGDRFGAYRRTGEAGHWQNLAALGHDLFIEAVEWGGHVAGIMSSKREITVADRPDRATGGYLLIFDALDGSSNTDINAPLAASSPSCAHAGRVLQRSPATIFNPGPSRSVPAMRSMAPQQC